MPSAVVVKAIKPKRFDDKAMRERLRYHGKKIGQEMKKDFEKTTRTWEHKVEFRVTTSGGKGLGGQVTEVSTDDEVYRYVDQGTAPHIIRARHARTLAFPSLFAPKTKRRAIGSGPGLRGPADTFRQQVHHPGTEAREFSQEIAKVWEGRFQAEMEAAMKGAAKASGHKL